MCTCPKSPQSCLTLCDPKDCSPPHSSVHGIRQASILEWVAMTSSRGSSWPWIKPISFMLSALAGRFFTSRAIWEAQKHIKLMTKYLHVTPSCSPIYCQTLLTGNSVFCWWPARNPLSGCTRAWLTLPHFALWLDSMLVLAGHCLFM